MKKILKVTGAVMAMLCLAACSKNDNNFVTIGTMQSEEADDTTKKGSKETTEAEEEKVERYTEFESGNSAGVRFARPTSWGDALSAEGIISAGNTGANLKLRKTDSSDEMILCFKPDCKHPEVYAIGLEAYCMSATYSGVQEIGFYEGMIYIFTGNEEECIIYRMDVETGKRELFAKLPYGVESSELNLIFCEDKMYCVLVMAIYEEEIEGKKISVDYEGLVEISLKDGSYRTITDGSGKSRISEVFLGGNTVYLQKYDSYDYTETKAFPYVVQIDLDTLKEKEVISPEVFNSQYKILEAYDEDTFYCYDMINYEISMRNIDGTKERVLVKGAEEETFRRRDVSNNGIFYERAEDYKNELAGTYFMDMTTGEITNISEPVDLYKLMEYDGYYDVFIGRDDDFNLWCYSRERILKEGELHS